MFSYRSILNSAWSITKQYKKMWIFGFLAFLLSAGGEYQILTKLLNEEYGPNIYNQSGPGSIISSSDFWITLYNICTTDIKTGLAVIMLMVLITILILFVLWLCVKSQIALVKWTKLYLNPKNKEKKISVWNELSTPDNNFWRVLGLNIFIKVVITLIFSILSLPLIYLYFRDSNLAILIYTVFFIVFLPIALSVSLIIKYSIAGVVLEKQSFVKSIEHGYELFKKNWLVSLETAILLFLINFMIGLLGVFVISVIVLPVILTLIIFGLIMPLYIITIICFLFLATIAAVLMTFQTSTWTILFTELRGESKTKNVKAKLERVFQKKITKSKIKK